MSIAEVTQLLVGTLQGVVASTVVVLVIFVGFCVIAGFTKLKRTAGGAAMVIKSLDERITLKPMEYLKPGAPRGPADQLKTPELVEAAGRQ